MADTHGLHGDFIFGVFGVMYGQDFLKAAKTVKDAYNTEIDFRSTVIASIMSVLRESKGIYSDDEIAVAIADVLFGGE